MFVYLRRVYAWKILLKITTKLGLLCNVGILDGSFQEPGRAFVDVDREIFAVLKTFIRIP